MATTNRIHKVAQIFAFAVLGLAFLVSQPGAQREETSRLPENENDILPGKTRYEYIADRERFEFNQLKDPRTGRIPRGIRLQESAFADQVATREQTTDNPDNLNLYASLGPTNLGGRTRAFGFDKRNANIRLSGGVSTGIFRTVNGGTTWTNVTPSGGLHNVSALAQDPRSGSEDIWYYGTGEALGNTAGGDGGAFYFGLGIFKSINNGLTWSSLPSTTGGALEGFDNPFDLVHRIVVDPTNGNVYAAVQHSIYRSIDGGTSWSIVLGEFGGGTNNGIGDIVVTTTGRFYASFTGDAGSTSAGGLPPSTALDGVWTSLTGASGSWSKILGSGAATPGTWKGAGLYGRIVLALAPSNNDILYILYDNKTVSNCAGTAAPEADFFKWTQSTTTGVDRSANLPDEPGCTNGNDPFAIQGGYDLAIAVKPDDENFVVIAGTNIYRSTNGFASTAATTRMGGYDNPNNYNQYTGHHADTHVLVFHPTTSTTMVSGDDGGIQEADVTATPVVWTNLNNSYVTYQYYHVALSPNAASTNFIGGLQDNGTVYSTGTATHTQVFSGDGASVGISAGNTWHYIATQNGNAYRRDPLDPPHFGTNIKPTGSGAGLFVTLFHLDFLNTEHLYYASNTALYRTTSASTVTSGTWTLMTGFAATLTGDISTLTTSYDVSGASHRLYVGTGDGKVYRLNDPANAAAGTAPTNITGAAFPAGANVSDIGVDPADNKKIMVTFSNYGVVSIWYTDDASVASPTWTAVEGDLTLPSVRSCKIVGRTGFPTEYYVGTSVGLYSTTALSGGTTAWVMEGPGLIARSVVRSLAYRPIDNFLLVGTHGNGMFTASVPNPLPIQLASFTGVFVNGGVRLNWRTISEVNNYGFYVQRRAENVGQFVEVPNSFVAGHGTTNEPQNYSFTHNNVAGGSWHYRLKQVDLDGTEHFTEPITISSPTSAKELAPMEFALKQNYPNPFNPETNIKFSIEQTGRATLELYNTLGQKVATLFEDVVEAGYYQTVKLNGSNLASGVYIYRLQSGQKSEMKKLILLR